MSKARSAAEIRTIDRGDHRVLRSSPASHDLRHQIATPWSRAKTVSLHLRLPSGPDTSPAI